MFKKTCYWFVAVQHFSYFIITSRPLAVNPVLWRKTGCLEVREYNHDNGREVWMNPRLRADDSSNEARGFDNSVSPFASKVDICIYVSVNLPKSLSSQGGGGGGGGARQHMLLHMLASEDPPHLTEQAELRGDGWQLHSDRKWGTEMKCAAGGGEIFMGRWWIVQSNGRVCVCVCESDLTSSHQWDWADSSLSFEGW